MRRHIAAWMTVTLLACGGASTTTEVSRAGAGVTSIHPADIAQRVHGEVNALRVRLGLNPVGWDRSLAKIATKHSRDMLRRDYFAHASPDGDNFSERYAEAGYRCRAPLGGRRYLTGGENLALSHHNARFIVYSDGRRVPAGFRTASQIARRVVVGWYNSPGHRRNMLTPQWRREGIGVVIGADGRIWVTQNFC